MSRRTEVRQIAALLLAVSFSGVDALSAQDRTRPATWHLDFQLEYFSLDDGPSGAPRGDNLGVGLRSGLTLPWLDHRVAVLGQASYLIPTFNNTPSIGFVGVDMVGTIVRVSGGSGSPTLFGSGGAGAGNIHPTGATLELICGEGAVIPEECVGRNRFAAGWRMWVQVGAGLEVWHRRWLPRRFHVQLVIPPERRLEDGQPPYLRLSLGWRLAG